MVGLISSISHPDARLASGLKVDSQKEMPPHNLNQYTLHALRSGHAISSGYKAPMHALGRMGIFGPYSSARRFIGHLIR